MCSTSTLPVRKFSRTTESVASTNASQIRVIARRPTILQPRKFSSRTKKKIPVAEHERCLCPEVRRHRKPAVGRYRPDHRSFAGNNEAEIFERTVQIGDGIFVFWVDQQVTQQGTLQGVKLNNAEAPYCDQFPVSSVLSRSRVHGPRRLPTTTRSSHSRMTATAIRICTSRTSIPIARWELRGTRAEAFASSNAFATNNVGSHPPAQRGGWEPLHFRPSPPPCYAFLIPAVLRLIRILMRFFALAFCGLLLSSVLFAESTRTWVQTKYDDYEKGTAHGIAINSDGSLTLAPAFKDLFTSPSTYIWDAAADAEGNVYAAAGSPARVYKITPAGKASIIFAAQELQVQALAIAPDGTIYAATSPDGKVYKIVHGGPAPGQSPEGSPHHRRNRGRAGGREARRWRGEAPRPRLRLMPLTARVSCSIRIPNTFGHCNSTSRGSSTSAPAIAGQIFRVDRNGKGSMFFQSDEAQIRCLALDNSGNLIAGTDGSGWCIASRRKAKPSFCTARRRRKSPRSPLMPRAISMQRARVKNADDARRRRPSGVRRAGSAAGNYGGSASGSALGERGPFAGSVVRSRRDGQPGRLRGLSHLSRWLAPHAVVVERRSLSMRWPSMLPDACSPAPATKARFMPSTGGNTPTW